MAITFYNIVTNRWIGCILKIYLQINCLDVKMYFQCYKEIRFHSIAKYPFHKCSKRTIAEEMVTTDMNHFPIGLNLLTKYHLGWRNRHLELQKFWESQVIKM